MMKTSNGRDVCPKNAVQQPSNLLDLGLRINNMVLFYYELELLDLDSRAPPTDDNPTPLSGSHLNDIMLKAFA